MPLSSSPVSAATADESTEIVKLIGVFLKDDVEVVLAFVGERDDGDRCGD